MTNPIVIKKGARLGELDAEADKDLLESCFVDSGQINDLLDIDSAKSIILGRTGSGKSALIHMIGRRCEHSIYLDPNDISIKFLEHSNIVLFFDELGVKLDLFYKVLWRHVFTVELLKLRYNLTDESETAKLQSKIRQWTQKDKTKIKALDYFNEWGNKFWLETDERLKELTSKFTSDVENTLGVKYSGIQISRNGAKNLTAEERTEITSLANRVVSEIQISRLNEVITLLATKVFEDRQKKYYILIDQLDEDWAETDTRCRFIRALIEETKYFRNIPQIKIITALRQDLLDLVFDNTRGPGFQEEKYEAYMCPIVWSKEDLSTVLNKRINEVFRRQYTNDNIHFENIFPSPKKHTGEESINYLLDRTFLRPRDAIQFANECFVVAAGRERVSWSTMQTAEGAYSQKRLKSLIEEWGDIYSALSTSIEILRGIATPFTRSSIGNDQIDSISEELCGNKDFDPCVKAIKNLYVNPSKVSHADVLSALLMCLYHVGAIGIKISSTASFFWSHLNRPRVTKSEVKRANQMRVHKMFIHALEIKNKTA